MNWTTGQQLIHVMSNKLENKMVDIHEDVRL